MFFVFVYFLRFIYLFRKRAWWGKGQREMRQTVKQTPC